MYQLPRLAALFFSSKLTGAFSVCSFCLLSGFRALQSKSPLQFEAITGKKSRNREWIGLGSWTERRSRCMWGYSTPKTTKEPSKPFSRGQGIIQSLTNSLQVLQNINIGNKTRAIDCKSNPLLFPNSTCVFFSLVERCKSAREWMRSTWHDTSQGLWDDSFEGHGALEPSVG